MSTERCAGPGRPEAARPPRSGSSPRSRPASAPLVGPSGAIALLLATACMPQGPSPLEIPTDPVLPDPALAPFWPDDGGWTVRTLDVRGRPGPVLPTAEALVVPTGFGLRRIPWDGGPPQEVATPGLATAVVEATPGVFWVADGVDGIARVALRDGNLVLLESHRACTVRSIARAGQRLLATCTESLLLAFSAGEDGRPTETGRVVLDGEPGEVSVATAGTVGVRWSVAARAGGLYWGSLDGDRPRLRSHRRDMAAFRTVMTPDGALAASAGAHLWGPAMAGEPIATGLKLCGLALSASGDLWLAADEAGVHVLRRGRDVLAPMRARSGTQALAVVADPEGPGVFASWSDGLVERLNDSGEPLGSWNSGAAGEVVLVSPGFSVLSLAADRHRVVPWDGGEPLDLPFEVADVSAIPGGALVAAQTGGAIEVRWEDGRPRSIQVRGGHAAAAVREPDGTTWIADESDGLVGWGPDGAAIVQGLRQDGGAVAVDVSDRWAVGAGYFGAELLAVPRGDDGREQVAAMLPGSAWSVALMGDLAVVAIPHWGLTLVPLDAGDWPSVRHLRMPGLVPSSRTMRLCPTPEGVLATLGERGVAVVRIEDGGARIDHVIQTPGAAIDCEPGAVPGTWLVADSTALVELSRR